MPFAVAAAGISAGAGLIGSAMQSKAIKSGQNAANAAIQQGIQTAKEQLSPWTTAGQNALGPLSSAAASTTPWQVGMGIDVAGQLSGVYGPDQAAAAMANFQTSPGYQFAVSEGLRGVDAGAAAQGILRSGATIKGEEAQAENLANQQYQTYLGNANTTFTNYYNRLMGLSNSGLDAAKGIADAATGGAKQIASTDTSAASAQSGVIGNTTGSLNSITNGLFNNPAFSSYINGTGGSGGTTYTDPVGSTTTNINPSTGLSYQSSRNPALNWDI